MSEPELRIYRTSAELPLPLYYQAQAFSRIFWSDGDDYDIDLGLNESAIVVVLVNGNSLITHAAIVYADVTCAGRTYKCCGLSSVMTFPAFRKRGYGGQVVQAATALIREDTAVDIALLWTAPQNTHFYSRYGWQALPTLTILMGDAAEPTVYDEEVPMMLFLSEKGRQDAARFEHGRVYVGEEGW
jgi:GNAT superfamily N-acetyltransferase